MEKEFAEQLADFLLAQEDPQAVTGFYQQAFTNACLSITTARAS